MSAAPSLLQGQCQPVAGASEARPPEPHNTAPGKPPAGKPDPGSPEFYDEPKSKLFDWGAELLLHHAAQPAMEVVARGSRMFPHSSRVLIALGVAWQAQGASDRALRCLFDASDLNPIDPTPSLFLGKMQNAEIV